MFLLPFHTENHSKSGCAAHHPLVSLGDSFQWKDFIHRLHAGQRTELERILRVDRRAGIPTLDRPLTADEKNRIDRERTGRTDHHEHAVRGQTAERRRHRVRVGYRSDDHLGTAKLVEFRSRIFLPTIDVMDRAQFFSEGFLVLPPRDRHRFEAHFRGKLDTEVTESTDPEYSNIITPASTAVAERVERCNTGAHERSAIDRRQF